MLARVERDAYMASDVTRKMDSTRHNLRSKRNCTIFMVKPRKASIDQKHTDTE